MASVSTFLCFVCLSFQSKSTLARPSDTPTSSFLAPPVPIQLQLQAVPSQTVAPIVETPPPFDAFGVLGAVGATAAAGLVTVGALAVLQLALGRKKRSAGADAFMESLKYFNLAMELDSEFCLPLVICEAASKNNKKGTKLQKAAAKTAEAG